MIRHLVSTTAAIALVWTSMAQAQPYDDQDPYTLPPGYNQVTGYEDPELYAQPGYAPDEDDADYYDAPPAEDYADDRSGYYAPPPAEAYVDDSHYNSGASVRGSSTYSRDGYVRSGETYSSRERSTSAEAYVEGEIEYDADGRVVDHRRAYAGSPDYVDEYGAEGRYESERSAYSARYAAAPFGYQRRFYAFSVATEETEELEVERREEYAYARRDHIAGWANGDIRLDSSFMGALTGGVEGQGPVMWSGGGGYASVSASASAFAGARAFAGVRAGRRGHHGRRHGCGC